MTNSAKQLNLILYLYSLSKFFLMPFDFQNSVLLDGKFSGLFRQKKTSIS